MPTYQYHCDNCGHEFEEFQSITEDPIDVCPQCQGKPRRLITGGAGLLFKGSGFYITDYRSAKYKADRSKDSSSATSSSSSSDSSKSSAKKESKGS
ncbi:MAG: zinc ribbon domain-containing protein [candidate division Zixibacteria bacterium]|nr:zinc ribbon domain-containing protein [candidate division Zixibacteria bacterium]